MMKYVRSRDGRVIDYDSERIWKAIMHAFQALGLENKKIVDLITEDTERGLKEKFGENGVPTVEEIQDEVERSLMANDFYDVAKAYILYRQQREEIRNLSFAMVSGDLVDDYINERDWRVNENANMGKSVSGLNFHISSEISKNYWLYRIYDREIRNSHVSGDIHIHDLGLIAPYCVGWDLEDILLRGFPSGIPYKLTSGPPRHFLTALLQSMNAFYVLQGEAAGAQAFSGYDTYMAPYIAKDDLSYKEVRQAVQAWLHLMNVDTRVGWQKPFTNITLDLVVPKKMESEPAVWGGDYQMDMTYGDFQDEMNMFNRAFCEEMKKGDASGRIFSFPIPTYNITPDFNWDFMELWEMTAKYGIPYFANFVNSELDPDDFRSMCCRLRLDLSQLESKGGGLFGAKPLTGSIGVATINMARLGYLSKSEDEYFDRLDELMEIAKRSLILKKKEIEKNTSAGMYPYSKILLEDIFKRFGNYWNNHFCTIGLLGMHDSCINMFGEGIASQNGLDFSVKVMNHMRERLVEFQNEGDGFMYNLEATPGEGTTRRFANLDKKKYPDIIVTNEQDYKNSGSVPFYTNSTQLPVDNTMTIGEQVRHQDNLQTLYTGGTVMHHMFGEAYSSPEGVRDLMRNLVYNSEIPYHSITPTFSICPKHNYISGKHFSCPICGAKTEVFSRIVGYFMPISQWNDAKKEEFKKRSTFEPGVTV